MGAPGARGGRRDGWRQNHLHPRDDAVDRERRLVGGVAHLRGRGHTTVWAVWVWWVGVGGAPL